MNLNANNHWKLETRVCPSCPPEVGPQPLENFNKCKVRPNGRTSQCKKCHRKRVKAVRLAKREYEKVYGVVKRKRNKRSQPKEAVLLAIKRGATTQLEILTATRLDEDTIGDVLARLWDEEKLDRTAIRQRRYLLAA